MEKKIWITWENHRRSIEIAKALNAKIFIIESHLPRFIRYIVNVVKTIYILLKEKPNIVFVQNPSIVLSALTCSLKKILKYKLVVDRHTNFKIGRKIINISHLIFEFLSNYTIKSADLTIVTNNYLKLFVKKKGGNSFVLPDKIPFLQQKDKFKIFGKYNVAFICTFSDDEPFFDVIISVLNLPNDIYVYITGDYNKYLKKIPNKIPDNIVFTGYLPEQDYIDLLFSVDVIIDFTELDWCLVCGGYEAMAADKPFITSNKKALRDFYTSGTVFCDHGPDNISSAIINVFNNLNKFQNEIKSLKINKNYKWLNDFVKLNKVLRDL